MGIVIEDILNKRSLEKLDELYPEVAEKAKEALLEVFKRHKIKVLVYTAYRPHEEQAALWRQSRSTKQIQKKIKYYDKIGRTDLADILRNGKPRNGKHVTNACCGMSYHEYRIAFDFVPYFKGNLDWNDTGKFKKVASVLKEYGFNCGAFWKSFKDYPHAQYSGNLTIKKLLVDNVDPQWWKNEEREVIA